MTVIGPRCLASLLLAALGPPISCGSAPPGVSDGDAEADSGAPEGDGTPDDYYDEDSTTPDLVDGPDSCELDSLLAPIAVSDFDEDGIENGRDEDDDEDGVPDLLEHRAVMMFGRCSLLDSDGDTRGDGFDTDSDGDTICDGAEQTYLTDRLNLDTDEDWLTDWLDIRFGFDPSTYDVELGGAPCGYRWAFPLLRGWTWGSLRPPWWEGNSMPASVEADLLAAADAEVAELTAEDVLGPLGGVSGLDVVSDMRIIEVLPAAGGSPLGPTTVGALRAGATVRVSVEFAWPTDAPAPPCNVGYQLRLSLVDAAGRAVSDPIEACMVLAISLETGEALPTHLCGVLPECPARDW